jgi:hypothetical protein
VWLRAVLLVTQPPQLKPMIMRVTAPPMKPHTRSSVPLEIAWQILSWPACGRRIGARTIAWPRINNG